MKALLPARIHWTDDNQPFASDFGDCYFSSHDGLAETQHVFINGNHLPERWRQLQDSFFVIGETGFGSGLNFVSAWKLWQDCAPAGAHLYFVSTELHPMRKEDLIKAASLWPDLGFLYNELIEQYPVLTPGFHTLTFSRVTLILLLGEANDMFNELLETDHPDFSYRYGYKFDAWFLDGFSPEKNPQLWTDSLLQTIALLSKPGTTLATFSAAGKMRRTLEANGFHVQKQKGFANKREMVTATFQTNEVRQQSHNPISMIGKPSFISSPYTAPWYINKNHLHKKHCNKSAQPIETAKEISIIGAGIAGCTLADALARKDFQVTVFDEESQAATQASGNQQAVLYGKFSTTDDVFAQFNLATFLFALRFYKQRLKEHPDLAIHLCGVLQLAWSKDEQETQKTLQDFFTYYPEIAQVVTREKASDVAGVPVETGGVFFPQAGWIHPGNICHRLLQHPNISTAFNQRITSLHHEKNIWHLMSNSKVIASSQRVVIANAHHCQQFWQTQFLPLKFIRGQVSHAKPTPVSKTLKTVLCGDGYIAPAYGDLQSFGATYTPAVTHLNIDTEDHEINLQHLEKSSQLLSTQWSTNDGITGGRTHTRTATSDYFPVCGSLPLKDRFLSDFALLRKNAHANILETGSYHPDLYVFSGLGSRGMTYAPLCAEFLSQLIAGVPMGMSRSMTQNLNPARFIIRDLIKNRI